ncbi:MAG: EamA family transporter [Egibacteraceae bacterium]
MAAWPGQLTRSGLGPAHPGLRARSNPLIVANLAGFAWLSIVGTGLAYGLWFRGIIRLPASRLTFLGLLSPLVATGLGWLVLALR